MSRREHRKHQQRARSISATATTRHLGPIMRLDERAAHLSERRHLYRHRDSQRCGRVLRNGVNRGDRAAGPATVGHSSLRRHDTCGRHSAWSFTASVSRRYVDIVSYIWNFGSTTFRPKSARPSNRQTVVYDVGDHADRITVAVKRSGPQGDWCRRTASVRPRSPSQPTSCSSGRESPTHWGRCFGSVPFLLAAAAQPSA